MATSSSSVRGTASPATSTEDSNRNVTAPKGAVILPKAVVARETELKGEVTIGAGTVLHPSAKVLAENGPVDIGAGNIIEEKVIIRNVFPPGPEGQKRTLYIGSKNLIEAYSIIEGNVGNYNTVACKARIGPSTCLSTGCVIGAMCVVNSDETLPPNTVIMGDNHMRRIVEQDQSPPFIDEHAEYLQKQLPNYHYILKSSV